MSAVDDAVLALLHATSLHVYDGYVTDSDENAKTISAPLPYVVYYGSPGYPLGRRLASRRNRHTEFTINAVGSTREQAAWAGAKAEAALDGVRVMLEGSGRMIRRTVDSPPVVRDDTWNRPDGGPLFLDSRRYSTSS